MKKTIALLAVFFLLTTGLGCKQSSEARNYKPVTLELWGVFEEPGDMQTIILPYTGRHPKIRVNYRQLREDEYKQKMLEAWATGKGPDMFMIPNTRLREFKKFITPMPSTMKAPVQIETGTIKKEILDQVQTYKGYTPKNVRDLFLDIVADDVVIENQIFGLPMSVDTLSVFYNRNILTTNNIAIPAKNWTELRDQAALISKVNQDEKIVQSTIALGTTTNIPNVLDIVSTMMMQIGVDMGDATGPEFHKKPEAINALQFYLSFAQKGVQNYSWSKDLPPALDLFTAGKLAYFIGYPYHANLIKEANPKLNFDVIPMFTPENSQNVPSDSSYWLTVVTKPPRGASLETIQKAELSWQFLSEITQANNVRAFLNNTNRPRTTALRSLVDEQKNDPVLGPFAQNLLTARSWYKGYDFELAQKYFLDMINNVEQASLNGIDPGPFLQAAGDLIGQTYREPTE